MMMIESLIGVANFELLPTEIIDEEIYYWPESEPFSVNFEMSGTESIFFLANIGFVMYLIYYHMFIAIVHACIHKIRNLCKCLQTLHSKIGTYLYWKGLSLLNMEIFMDLAFLSILNLHTVDWTSQLISVKISNALSALVLTTICGILIFYIVSYFC